MCMSHIVQYSNFQLEDGALKVMEALMVSVYLIHVQLAFHFIMSYHVCIYAASWTRRRAF